MKPSWQIWTGAIALLLIGSCAGSSSRSDENGEATLIRIGGSAETLEIVENLADTYEASEKGININFLPPSQSSGGIQGVKDEVLDIGAVSSDPLTATLEGLQYVPLTQTPLVIIVHETVVGIQDITQSQLQDIYDGTIANWQDLGGPDAEIILLDFTEDENEKALLRQHVLGDDLQITEQAVVFPEDDEIFETAIVTHYSIAAIPLEEDIKEAPVQILLLDGVAPTPENMQSGAYAMQLTLGLVIADSPTVEVQNFLDFILSPEGQAILTDNIALEEP